MLSSFFIFPLLTLGLALSCFQLIAGKNMDTAQDRSLVRSQILANYDKTIIPDNVTVKFGMALIRFDAHPEINRVDIFGWLRFVWSDSRLKWNETTTKNNVAVIRVPSEDVWKPDIVLYNSYEPEKFLECAQTHTLVYQSGEVLWVPPCSFGAMCDMRNIRKDPNAKQSCHLKFGSWTMDGNMMDLGLYNDIPEVDLSDFWDISPNWRVTGTNATRNSKTYPCCPEPYPDVHFYVEFERRNVSLTSGSISIGGGTAIQHLTHSPYYNIHFVCLSFLALLPFIQIIQTPAAA